MHEFVVFVFWVLMTLGIASFSAYLGKVYGVAFPIGIMGTLVVIASVLANKLVVVGNFVLPAGIIVASSTFLITDILSEKWGRQTAQQAVWVGFYGIILFVISLWIAIEWAAPEFAQGKADMFKEVLGLTPRITFASIVAYFVSQNHDVWAFEMWREKFNGRHLWLRNNASTIVSQFIDSVIFITIAFYGVLPIGQMIIDMWMIKTLIALLDTPMIYIVRWMINREEQKVSMPTISF